MKAGTYMKAGTVLIALICGTFFTAALCRAAEKPAAQGPRAVFPAKHFTFSSVIEGAEVQHDFVVQNKGSKTLKILNVRTG